MGNAAKSAQLGMPFGTASHKLRKAVLFALLVRHGENVCYRCTDMIESADQLSLDHKKPWFGFATDLFWDVENVAFSHTQCNTDARRKTSRGHADRPRVALGECSVCRAANLPESAFFRNANRHNGLSTECKECRTRRGRGTRYVSA